MITAITKLLYGLVGITLLVAGSGVLLLGTGLLPKSVRDLIRTIGGEQPTALHILQELGTALVFMGLITFWFLWHYPLSRPFHWAMTLFWALFALVHWLDVNGSFHNELAVTINAIPLGLFLLVGLLRHIGEEPRALLDRAR
jgi:hypothetical protein